MKHFTKLFVGILFLILGGTQSGFAKTIDNMLLEKAITPEEAAQKKYDVFLYNVDKKTVRAWWRKIWYADRIERTRYTF